MSVDIGNYLRVSEPFESTEEYSAAIKKFYAEVEKLRNELGIPDVLIVCRSNVAHDDGKIGSPIHMVSFGNQMETDSLAAYAYGALTRNKREVMNKLLAGSFDDM